MYPTLFTLGGLALASAYLLRKPAAGVADPFLDAVAADAAAALSRHTGADAETYRSPVRAAAAADPALADVLRIEVTVRPAGRGGRCDREVRLAVRSGDEVCVLQATRPVAWNQLPAPVRRGFFRDGHAPQTFLLLDRAAAN